VLHGGTFPVPAQSLGRAFPKLDRLFRLEASF
jgi:hypothetical protein